MKLLKASLFIITIFAGADTFSQSYLAEKSNPKFKVQASIKLEAYAFNLKDVRLLNGSPFKHAMDIDGAYMLSLSADKLLSRFYKNSGLQPKDMAKLPEECLA